MKDCQCKSGFFSLRDCGQPGLAVCSVCNRAMCHQHSAVESQFTQCRDCWARDNQQAVGGNAQRAVGSNARPVNRNDVYDDDWAYSYRNRYYAGYAPIYTGSHYHRYYDQYDTRSFSTRSGDFDDDSDAARAGFGDS